MSQGRRSSATFGLRTSPTPSAHRGSAQGILADLIAAGYVQRQRFGQRNRYVVDPASPMFRHQAQEGHDIGSLLELLRLKEARP
jgi:hypothetical protein